MKKTDEIADPSSCLNKAANDEPVFVLRANDPLAAGVVDYWANLAEGSNLHEVYKINMAREFAQEMRRWRTDKKRE